MIIHEEISFRLFILTNIFIIILIIFHLLACRVANRTGGLRSPQMFLINSVLYINIPLTFCIMFIASLETRGFIGFLLMLSFGLLVYNSFSYVYFHFFNMSETARRIRILIQLYENNSISIDQLKNEYNSGDMINSRLERLLKMGEIKKNTLFVISEYKSQRLNQLLLLFRENA